MNTVRETVLSALETALAELTVANGYSYNYSVLRGIPQVDTPPAIVIFDGETQVSLQSRVHRHVMPVSFEGHVSLNGGDNSAVANAVVGDIIAGVNSEFSMAGVVVNLISYAVQYNPEITDSVAAVAKYEFIYFTPRNDPSNIVEI